MYIRETMVIQEVDSENKQLYYTQGGGLGFLTKYVDTPGLVETEEDVISKQIEMQKKVPVRRVYTLWKNGAEYYVHGLAYNIDNGEYYVVYQALYGEHGYYSRRYDDFISKIGVERSEENKTGQKIRFEVKN